MHDSASLRQLLAEAVEGVRSAGLREKFLDAAGEVCKIGRSLNFALADEWCPEPAVLAGIADELANASSLVLAQIASMEDLTNADRAFADRVARHALARAEDVRRYGAAAEASGAQAALAV